MWIMIVIGGMFGQFQNTEGNSAASTSITAVEFSSRDRCVTAAAFTKQQPKIYNAFCVQK